MKVTLYFEHVNVEDYNSEAFSQYIEWGDSRKLFNLCQQFSLWNSHWSLQTVGMEGKNLMSKSFKYDSSDDLEQYQKYMDSTVLLHPVPERPSNYIP